MAEKSTSSQHRDRRQSVPVVHAPHVGVHTRKSGASDIIGIRDRLQIRISTKDECSPHADRSCLRTHSQAANDCPKNMHQLSRNIIGFILGLPFVWIGIQHFENPDPFNAIVPGYLGWPLFWTYASGVLEVLLGLGIMLPPTRRMAARILFTLVILMSLANLNMWINDIPYNGTRLTTTGHIIRWTIQVILLLVLLWLGEVIPRSRKTAETA